MSKGSLLLGYGAGRNGVDQRNEGLLNEKNRAIAYDLEVDGRLARGLRH
ncbi:hypothetical protein [Sinorhizobium medicae]